MSPLRYTLTSHDFSQNHSKDILSEGSDTLLPETDRSIRKAVDRTLEQQWLPKHYQSLQPIKSTKHAMEDLRPAYCYGLIEKLRRRNVPYDQVEDVLEDEWDCQEGATVLDQEETEPAARHSYTRSLPVPRTSK